MRDHSRQKFLLSRTGFSLAILLALVAVYLWLDHKAHVIEVLPLLLPLLICVGMHVFMHRGHGSHRRHGHTSENMTEPVKNAPIWTDSNRRP